MNTIKNFSSIENDPIKNITIESTTIKNTSIKTSTIETSTIKTSTIENTAAGTALSNIDRQQLAKALLLYAVTDNTRPGSHTPEHQVKAALDGGITMLQLREKYLDEQEFAAEARAIKKLTSQYGIPLIINDNLNVALQCDADGLHIGQDDVPVAVARAALGRDKILGVSAHTVGLAIAAEAAGADYIGTGAMFATATKDDAAAVSIDTLAEICRSVSIPVVAIGGVSVSNMASLFTTGIAGVAIVSAIFAQPDITRAARTLYTAACQYHG